VATACHVAYSVAALSHWMGGEGVGVIVCVASRSYDSLRRIRTTAASEMAQSLASCSTQAARKFGSVIDIRLLIYHLSCILLTAQRLLRTALLYTTFHYLSTLYSILLTKFITFQCIIMLLMGSTEFTEWVNEEVEKRSWSFRELGRRAGLSSGAISKVMTGAALPGWELCKRIAIALDVPPEYVFSLAGLLAPKPEETASLRNLLHVAAQLPEDDLERLVGVARTFQEQAKREGRLREAEAPS
jgi:transcriptional regulator with XRE-family HTH domain